MQPFEEPRALAPDEVGAVIDEYRRPVDLGQIFNRKR